MGRPSLEYSVDGLMADGRGGGLWGESNIDDPGAFKPCLMYPRSTTVSDRPK
jgi:hypothetical protein